MDLKIRIQGRVVEVEWENRSAVAAIMNKLSAHKKIFMTKKGIRQVGSLGISIPRNDRSFIAHPGDIAIEGGNLVFFEGEDDVSCTKLGHFKGSSETAIKNMLSPGSINVEFFEG